MRLSGTGEAAMRFSIRDLFALTAIAAVTLGVGIPVFAADNPEELFGLLMMFLVGACCYGAGKYLWTKGVIQK
jgi:hypothetical protein